MSQQEETPQDANNAMEKQEEYEIIEPKTQAPVLKEVNHEPKIGEVIGQCKWFNDSLGFGFLTVQNGPTKGTDIFVHHTGIKPLNSNYKTLKKGEYVNFDIIAGDNGQQAVNVTGIGGGSLICDVTPYHRVSYNMRPRYPTPVRAIVPPPPPPPPRNSRPVYVPQTYAMTPPVMSYSTGPMYHTPPPRRYVQVGHNTPVYTGRNGVHNPNAMSNVHVSRFGGGQAFNNRT